MSGPVLNAPEPCCPSSPRPSVEDRGHDRRRLHSLVRITYCADPARSAHIGRGVDISASGVSFQIGTVLDFHRLMMLEYTDDEGRNCRRTARLRYRINRTYGASFADIEPDEVPQ